MRKQINGTPRADTGAEREFYCGRYPTGYKTDQWADHVQRVDASIQFVVSAFEGQRLGTIADLSCGDGKIAEGIAERTGSGHVILGDINPNSSRLLAVHGALPGTIGHLDFLDGPVDLYILSETIEHIKDPDFVLEQLRPRARNLFLSTPVSEPDNHGNAEHYWSWSMDDMEDMLRSAGWTPAVSWMFVPVPRPPSGYDFQMWVCS